MTFNLLAGRYSNSKLKIKSDVICSSVGWNLFTLLTTHISKSVGNDENNGFFPSINTIYVNR